MTKSKDEKRELVRAWKAQQRKQAEKILPAPKNVLLKLFDHLSYRLVHEPCDHSLRLTLAWASTMGLDGHRVVTWTREYGGFCDCEVLANVRSENPAFSHQADDDLNGSHYGE